VYKRQGLPANECEAVTIIAKDGLTSDALSTGIFVMGTENGMRLIEKLADVEALIVDSTGSIHQSSGFEKFLLR
jgi:thiamine biosynthesis lipoprotein